MALNQASRQAADRQAMANWSEEAKEPEMKKWQRPVIVEIQVGMEINLYVCAEL